jgi:HK97 family phage major capsid protein
MKHSIHLAVASLALVQLAARPLPAGVAFAPRGDINADVKSAIEKVNQAFEEFKSTNDEKLKAKSDDAVVNAKLEKIDSAIDGFQTTIDELNARIAAGAGGGEQLRDPEYTGEFNAYFKTGVETSRLNEVRAAATKTDGEGGYLAPIEWDRTVTTALKQVSPIRQHASVIAISGAGFSKVVSDGNTGSGWVGETAARPATTTPGLSKLDFPLGELYANPAASQGLIDDAEVDIEAWLADEVRGEFAKQEGIAFLSGNGTNKPHGILTYVTGAANAARHPLGAIEVTVSGDATKITADGMLDLIYSLPEEFEANAKLFMNRRVAGSIRKLKDSQGQYLWQPSLAVGQPASFSGEPIVHLPAMPTVGAGNIAALYGDMAETYQVIDRIGVRVLRDPYTNKPFVHFYTTKRVGGGVKNPQSMKALQIAAAA